MRNRRNKKAEHPSFVIAKERGIRIKNPKDYVVIMGNRIIDGRRVMEVRTTLPENLPEGLELNYETTKAPVTVIVHRDYGENVEVIFKDEETGKTETRMVERTSLMLPFVGATKPMLIHKSKLAKMFGPKIGKLFWDGGFRVPAAPPPSLRKKARS